MPYCTECGSEVEQEARFCPNCGHDLSQEASTSSPSTVRPSPTQYSAQPTQYSAQPTQYSAPSTYQQYHKSDNTKGIIALVFGILGFVLLPFIGSIVAIILGALSRSQEEDTSLGTIGIVLGILGMVCWVIFFVFLFSWIFSMMGSYPYYY
jgi:uncharacterized membrane protein YvbJ